MHRPSIAAAALIAFSPASALAQTEPQGFFEKYLNIAKLFDSPAFFAFVVGSAVALFTASLIFLWAIKRREREVEAWGKHKETDELVKLLDSPVKREAQMAFMYLRNHGNERGERLVIQRIQEHRKKGVVNPYPFYLIEDWQASEAIPVLRGLAKGKSRAAQLAQCALRRFGCAETENG